MTFDLPHVIAAVMWAAFVVAVLGAVIYGLSVYTQAKRYRGHDPRQDD